MLLLLILGPREATHSINLPVIRKTVYSLEVTYFSP